jgi:NDP-sugar pyrophosphorylase family protein
MDVIILCGGLGKRLRGVINDKPKPMATIGQRPFLDILMSYTSRYEFRRFILCVSYMKEFIREYYRGKEGIVFSEEEKPLGTGGAIKKAEALLQSRSFLVMNGDSFISLDLNEFLAFHSRKQALASIALTPMKRVRGYGTVKLGDGGEVLSFDEKSGEGTLINAGVYLFERDVLSLIPPGVNYSLEYDLFPQLIGKGFYGYQTEGVFVDIGAPEGYKRAQQILEGY